VLKPVANDTYNHSMNVVGYSDQHYTYLLMWSTLKWWEKFLSSPKHSTVNS